MKQASKKKQPGTVSGIEVVRYIKEISFIFMVAGALFIALSLFTYHPADPGWSQAVSVTEIHNDGGIVGAWVANVLLYLFGYPGYLFPLVFIFDGWRIFKSRRDDTTDSRLLVSLRILGLILLICGCCALAWLHIGAGGRLPEHLPDQASSAGGILGLALGPFLFDVFGYAGSSLLMLAMLLAGMTLYSGMSWLWLIEKTGYITLRTIDKIIIYTDKLTQYIKSVEAKKERVELVRTQQKKVRDRPPPRIEPVISKVETSARAEAERQEPLFEIPAESALPPLNLLDQPTPSQGRYSEATLEAMSRQVELKLLDFNIQVDVVAVNPGPVITRFELQPAPGVKGSQISNLSKDLARSLSVVSVRVVDVIPGKSVIGLEIPNTSRELVTLSEILSSKEYEELHSTTVLGLGKDISGHPVVMDLSRMPHLLVAGTTGSGKSVAINAMILSLLYKSPPKKIRLIMIDPKMLELSVYEGIPHLLTPVVTDMKEAANALRWCVSEMERRYRLMATLGVRNINGYNKKINEAASRRQPLTDPFHTPVDNEDEAPALEELPYIVILIDELADMMMTVGKKVEELIARLAQKARASGIHLILATQRPSVDVITGLIKANIPCRIAFQVSSKVDSRTILDQMGAENLLGNGDMLFLPPGTSVPIRVHGAFVDDHEVHKVVENIKSRGGPNYMNDITLDQGGGDVAPIPGLEPVSDDVDPLYDEAVRIVTETRKTSISYIQRRLKIGYNRAARIVEEMEASGLVGPLEANGSREILAGPPPPVD
ncbi:MAG: DNA translocase FtsK 4TM domain-containing protein [Gammaproteobacteria bacterium]|nr:DNA translocase FtsK 4TM domain-containing protein [Gammaproteobacteria bacterium]